ncbi:unnamed protein product [Owenia fusiformis]|uniref:Uncharacterized protein n=1 Tax=Owenia fusiformis TaxID=6347 RepID=A0A8J1UVF8_OWEFU|nr:unnamed protein product [Owenia fusiformis]
MSATMSASPLIRRQDDRDTEFWTLINDLRVNGKLCDILLSVTRNDGSDVEYPAHKAVLAACSRYFASNIDVLASVTIHKLSEISELGLKAVLDVMYRQDIPKLILESTEVKHAAEKLKIALPDSNPTVATYVDPNPQSHQRPADPSMPMYTELALGLIQSYERSGLGDPGEQLQQQQQHQAQLQPQQAQNPHICTQDTHVTTQNTYTMSMGTLAPNHPQNPSFSPSMYSESSWRPELNGGKPEVVHHHQNNLPSHFQPVLPPPSVQPPPQSNHHQIQEIPKLPPIPMTGVKPDGSSTTSFEGDSIPEGTKRKPLAHLDLSISKASRANRLLKKKKRKNYKDPFLSGEESDDEIYNKFAINRAGDIRPAKTRPKQGHNTKEKCTMCGKTYNLTNILRHIWRAHQVGDKPKNPFISKKFPYRAPLASKPSYSKRRIKVSCHMCGLVLSQACLKTHIERTHKKVKRHACNVCGKGFYDLKNMRMHIEHVHEGKRPFSCEICDKSVARLHTLQMHLGIQHGLKWEKYELLREQNKLGEIKMKWLESGGNKSRTKTEPSRGNFKNRTPVPMWPDPQPDQVAPSMVNLHGIPVQPPSVLNQFPHLQMKTRAPPSNNQQRYSCNICGESYATNGSLTRHVTRIHEGNKKFACQFCGRKCFDSTALKYHVMTHTGEKNQVCPMCPYKCIKKAQLIGHIKTKHEGTTKKQQKFVVDPEASNTFFCNQCDFSSKYKGSLKMHMMRLHGDGTPHENVICPDCGKSFRFKDDLHKHNERVHLKIKRVQCKGCGCQFYTKRDLDHHKCKAMATGLPPVLPSVNIMVPQQQLPQQQQVINTTHHQQQQLIQQGTANAHPVLIQLPPMQHDISQQPVTTQDLSGL